MEVTRCPSCGASTTNFINCEYCGSLFVRYSHAGLNADEIFKPNPDTADVSIDQDLKKPFGNFGGFAFGGLKEAFDKNLSLQKQDTFIVTDVFIDEDSKQNNKQGFIKKLFSKPASNPIIIQIVESTGMGYFDNPSFPGLAIHIPFMKGDNGEFSNETGLGDDIPLSKFEKMKESVLFETRDASDDCIDKIIDFGNDSRGAAYLVSKLLVEFFGISKIKKIKTTTTDYS